MRDVLLNDAHDLELIGGDLVITSESRQEVGQHIKQRLLAIKGEWFLDQNLGLPWFDTILGKHSNLDIVEALLRSQIVGTPGVVTLTEFSLTVPDAATRVARVTFAVSLSDNSLLTAEVAL